MTKGCKILCFSSHVGETPDSQEAAPLGHVETTVALGAQVLSDCDKCIKLVDITCLSPISVNKPFTCLSCPAPGPLFESQS